jgi:hypothetical protein
MLPHVEGSTLTALRHQGISNLHQLLSFTADRIRGILKSIFVPSQVADFMQVCVSKPLLHSWSLCMPAALTLLGSLIVGHHSDGCPHLHLHPCSASELFEQHTLSEQLFVMGVAGMDASATYGIDLEVFFKHKG